MKSMGIKVKILSQEAVEFMQFDPMHKVEDILRDMAVRVLPDRYSSKLFVFSLCNNENCFYPLSARPVKRGTTLTTAYTCSERTPIKRVRGCRKKRSSTLTSLVLRWILERFPFHASIEMNINRLNQPY